MNDDFYNKEKYSLYCFCSGESFETMLQKQIKKPLDFAHFIEQYTSCYDGCGSCVEKLEIFLANNGALLRE